MIGACTDVSRRKAFELEALAANAKFRAVFDQTTAFSGVLSTEGIVLDANRLCLEACGYRADEVLGKPFWQTGWWRGSPEVQDKIQKACPQAAQGLDIEKNFRITGQTAASAWWSSNFIPFATSRAG